MDIMMETGKRGAGHMFASVIRICLAISAGCVVGGSSSTAQPDPPALEGAPWSAPQGDMAPMAGAPEPAARAAVGNACICPVELPAAVAAGQDVVACVFGCGTCGDGLCDSGETAFNCPSDCGPVCGDGVCDAGESFASCPVDCPPPPPPPTPCGDGVCKNAFSVTAAQAQLRYAWGSYCRANPGLSAGGTPRPGSHYLTDQAVADYNAAGAALQPYLFPIYFDFVTGGSWNVPDGAGTNCAVLPTSSINATLCVAGCYKTPVCGNGTCEIGESSSTCAADCGPPPPVCGNGVCEAGESRLSCRVDCGPPTTCGDGICQAGERVSCPSDCDLCLQNVIFCAVN